MLKVQNKNKVPFANVASRATQSKGSSQSRDKTNTAVNSMHNLSNIDGSAKRSGSKSCGHSFASQGYCPFGGACHTCPSKVQTKLRFSAPGDKYEKEADQVADKLVATSRSTTGSTNLKEPQVHYKYHHFYNKGQQGIALRKAVSPFRPSTTGRQKSGGKALFSTGKPLDSKTRINYEQKLGRDLSKVRVHTGSEANKSASALDAHAYTSGQNIVFASGAYSPNTPSGQKLLGHELVHTIQQSSLGANSHVISRRGKSAGGFFRNIGRAIAGWFGPEPSYKEEDLKNYLKDLDKHGNIENDYDSDNKARAVVNQGLYKKQPIKIRILLIKEMLSGFTGNADEKAILIILNSATPAELEQITDTITFKVFYDKFHGKELDQLYVALPDLERFYPRGENETKKHTFDDYVKKWEAERGRPITPDEKRTLAAGCIGITSLNIGTTRSPKLTACYAMFEQAWRKAKEFNSYLKKLVPGRKAIIFSKRFWSGGKDYKPDPKTGEVNMSGYNYGTRPGKGYTNFDYGFYDEKTNKWWHANHCEPTISGPRCTSSGSMYVYESNLQHYSRPLGDFDKQVFCIGISKYR